MASEQQFSEAGLPTNQPLPPKQSQSLGRLAQRISAWTTNSLLTLMLVVIALGFGRQVLRWWHDEGSPAGAGPADPLGDRTAAHVLEFGDQAWSMRRQEFFGPAGGVSAALQAAGRAAIVDCRPRGESPDASEQEVLKQLAGQRPVAEVHGQWRLYVWGPEHPVLIGTRAVESGEQGAGAPPAPRSATGTRLDETPYRVVIWGMAVPAADHAGHHVPMVAAADAWTLYLFQSGGGACGQGQGRGEIPLPPGGHRLVSIRAAGGDAITAFSTDDGDAVRGFYDRWFADRGWTAVARWRPIAAGWHSRFEVRSHAPALAVDIRLGIDPQGRWTGLVMESGQ